jgi:hypothetical protein
MRCNATLNPINVPIAEDCNCPDWIIDGATVCTVSRDGTLGNNAVITATLPRQFKRKGCE